MLEADMKAQLGAYLERVQQPFVLSAALDGSADDEDILMLLDMSFDMTYTKTRAGKTK